MGTTISVRENTWQVLQDLKKETNAKNLDEVINRLIRRVRKIPTSLMGAYPDIERVTTSDEREFDEL